MSRVHNTARNTVFATFKIVLQFALQFAVRSIFILVLGRELLGLDSLIINIILLLSITELGIGAAIGYSMYKPIAEKNTELVKSLYHFYVKLYWYIVIAIALVGVCVAPFLNFFIKGGSIPEDINIHLVYFIMLAGSLLTYMAATKRTLLFVAQRNDILSKGQSINMIVMRSLQIGFLLLVRNYYIFVSFVIVGVIAEYFYIQFRARKLFPEIHEPAQKLDKKIKAEIGRNVIAMGLGRLGGVVSAALIGILISRLFGLGDMGICANYILILGSVNQMLDIFSVSVRASIGDMIAKESTERNFEMFKILNFGFLLLVGLATALMVCLYQPFIELWINTKWVLPTIVMVSIVLHFYVGRLNSIPGNYKDAAGLMWNTRYVPIIFVLLQIGFSILLAHFIGLAGIFLGVVIANILTNVITTPWVVYKRYFNHAVTKYFLSLLSFSLVTAVACAVSFYLCNLLPVTIIGFMLRFAICGLATGVIYILAFGFSPSMKSLVRFATRLTGRLKRHS